MLFNDCNHLNVLIKGRNLKSNIATRSIDGIGKEAALNLAKLRHRILGLSRENDK